MFDELNKYDEAARSEILYQREGQNIIGVNTTILSECIFLRQVNFIDNIQRHVFIHETVTGNVSIDLCFTGKIDTEISPGALLSEK